MSQVDTVESLNLLISTLRLEINRYEIERDNSDDPVERASLLATITEAHRELNHLETRRTSVETGRNALEVPVVQTSKIANVIQKLKKNNINRPDPIVIQRIGVSSRLLDLACLNTENAAFTYVEVRDTPGKETCECIGKELGMHINSPFNNEHTNILSAFNIETEKTCMMKIIKSNDSHKGEIENEIVACTFNHPGIVPMTYRKVTVTTELARIAQCRVGEHDIIIMPWFKTSLFSIPTCMYRNIATQGRKILETVTYLHSKYYVHMDIKSLNIFVNFEDEWFLGDFGSCVKDGLKHTSSSYQFWYKPFLGDIKAGFKFDFFMLLLMILMQTLNNRGAYLDEFYDKYFIEEKEEYRTYASFTKVITYAKNFNKSNQLKILIDDIVGRLRISLQDEIYYLQLLEKIYGVNNNNNDTDISDLIY